MSHPPRSPLQDTAIAEVARDGLALVSAWTMVGMAVGFLAIVVLLVFVLFELRRLSQTFAGFLAATEDRSRPILEHVGNAARNLDHVTTVARSEADRLNSAIGTVANDIGEVSAEARRRLADLSALLDLAQSEAEEAVLDIASKARMLRKGAGLLERVWGGVAGSAPAKPPATPAGGEDRSGGEGDADVLTSIRDGMGTRQTEALGPRRSE